MDRRHLIRGLVLASLVSPLAIGDPVAPDGDEELGRALFGRHCAACHGEDGRAQGSISRRLRPRPRDFGSGRFRIVSSENGAPTDDDLLGVLRRGMPGSAMPSFARLPEEELRLLVAQVRRLAVDGLAETIARESEWWEGLVLEPAEARRRAVESMTPDALVDVTVPPDPDGALRARGEHLYSVRCLACHGPDGRGLRVSPRWSDGQPLWARDFTVGVMKGGATLPDLIRRIRTGLPGTVMPPTRFERPEDAAAVALHVRGLLRPGAEDRQVQVPSRITARRVERIAGEPDDALWTGGEVSIVLSPMVWSDGVVLEAAVTAMHDGEQLAVRIRWEDGSHDADPLRGARLPDAVALQWSDEAEAPLFGMGESAQPHDVWRWRAFRPDDVPGFLDLVEAGRGAESDVGYAGSADLGPHGESLRAEGLGEEVVIGETDGTLEAAAKWRDGVWSVVLRRRLVVSEEGAIGFAPGTRRAVAVAIWNGAAGDAGLRKSITIWHDLALEE